MAGKKEIPKGRARASAGQKSDGEGRRRPSLPALPSKRGVGGRPWGRRRGGAAPPYWQSYLPAYTGQTKAVKGRQEQVEGTEESDSKVNVLLKKMYCT